MFRVDHLQGHGGPYSLLRLETWWTIFRDKVDHLQGRPSSGTRWIIFTATHLHGYSQGYGGPSSG